MCSRAGAGEPGPACRTQGDLRGVYQPGRGTAAARRRGVQADSLRRETALRRQSMLQAFSLWSRPGHRGRAPEYSPQLASSSSRIPKGFRLKAQGCEPRATLGKPSRQRPTPTGLRLQARTGGRNPVGVGTFWPSSPRVARGSQPWAGGHNPFGIGEGVGARLAWVDRAVRTIADHV